MSACNVSFGEGTVTVATDGIAWNRDGIVTGWCSKIYPMPRLPAVVATRGPSLATMVAGDALSRECDTFDDLVAGLEERFPAICMATEYFGGAELTGALISLVVAGISESRKCPEAYQIMNHEAEMVEGGIESEAFKLRQFPSDAATVVPPVEDADLERAMAAAVGNIGPDADTKDLYELLILELQRQQRTGSVHDNSLLLHSVGGHATIAVVSASGITVRVIHKWPDRIGELIRPTPITDWAAWWRERSGLQPLPAEVPALSRVRREMAERKARKAQRMGAPGSLAIN